MFLDIYSRGGEPSILNSIPFLLENHPNSAISSFFTMLLAALLAFTALVEAVPKADVPSWLSKRQGSTTMLRFGCPQLVIDRIDPLVNPGQVPSTHVHQIIGGNAFNASMASTDISSLATCTTCQFSEDLSNYWTANLYFKARNGTYKRVPQGGAA